MKNLISTYPFICLMISLSALAVNYRNADEFGNKTANLAKESATIEMLQKQNIPVSIPAFFAISHQEIKAFLTATKEMDTIEHNWHQFKLAQKGHDELTKPAQEALKNIRASLKKAFETEFLFADQNRLREWNRFLQATKQYDLKLMVRSSGREDALDIANAGGNISVANVAPIPATINQALGKVLQSYVSEKSIQQRMASGESETSLFRDLFFPVLIQQMIGEKKGQEIPTSGVVFSRETFGNTEGVVSIDATFGHGEAVVNSLYPVDSFFVGPSSLPHAIVRKKHTRLVPGGEKSVLVPHKNEKKDETRPSLNEKDILHLKAIAYALEKARGHAVDIEFVIISGHIYVVQVRPIVMAKNNPSYLASNYIDRIPQDKIVPMTTIVSGGGALQHIRLADEIIVAENIRKALDNYLSLKNSAQQKIKLIISLQNAPYTSHEASTFRSNAKPVMWISNLEELNRVLASGHEYVADVQRGIFLQASNFDEALNTKAGWLRHPLPVVASIHPEFLPRKLLALGFNHEALQNKSNTELLNLIENEEDSKKASEAIETLRFRIRERVQKEIDKQKLVVLGKSETIAGLGQQLEAVLRYFMAATNEVSNALKHYGSSSKTPEDRLKRLYPVNFLKAAFMQMPTEQDIVLPLSILGLLKEQQRESFLLKGLDLLGKESRGFVVQYAKIGRYALRSEVFDQWMDFLKQFDGVKKADQQAFASMISKLANLQILPLWLHLVFFTTDKDLSAQKRTTLLLKGFTHDQEFLEFIAQRRLALGHFPFTSFESPKKFEGALSALKNDILLPLTGDNFTKAYQGASVLGKAAAQRLLHDMVSELDLAIKAQSRSKEYQSPILQATNCALMLDENSALQDYLARSFISPTQAQKLIAVGFASMDEYLQEIHALLTRSRTKAKNSVQDAAQQLLPSSSVNVSGAKLGSQASFKRSLGTELGGETKATLEDVFSLIHQNLLVILGHMMTELPIEKIPVPPLVDLLKDRLLNLDLSERISNFQKPQLVGAELDNHELRYFFNQSLRNHSNMFEVSYNLATQKTYFRVIFVGESRDRWPIFASYVRWILPTKGLKASAGPTLDAKRGVLDFTWEILNEQTATLANDSFRMMLAQSNIEGMHWHSVVGSYGRNLSKEDKKSICLSEFNYNMRYGLTSSVFFEYLPCDLPEQVEDSIIPEIIRLSKAGLRKQALEHLERAYKMIKYYFDFNDYEKMKEALESILSGISSEECASLKWNGENILFFIMYEKFYAPEKIGTVLQSCGQPLLLTLRGTWQKDSLFERAITYGNVAVVDYLALNMPEMLTIKHSDTRYANKTWPEIVDILIQQTHNRIKRKNLQIIKSILEKHSNH